MSDLHDLRRDMDKLRDDLDELQDEVNDQGKTIGKVDLWMTEQKIAWGWIGKIIAGVLVGILIAKFSR